MADEKQNARKARRARVAEIRLIALAEVATKSASIDPWRYYGELKQLAQRPMTTEWLEAAVMICAIGKIRPAKAMGFLAKLKQRREEAGERDQFDAFDARVRDYLAPYRMTNHAYSMGTFADVDNAAVWQKVEAHLSDLRDEGYEVFLNSGTLLGLIRDERLIEHDDDIDLAVILKSKSEAKAAEEWQGLRAKLEARGIFDAKNYDQPAVYKLLPAGETQIDLFPAWVQRGKVYVFPHTHGELSQGDVLPLRTCEITGNALPANPEKMLAINYGENWRTPDPTFKFPWTAARKRFAPFLERLSS